jgi:undecaprenyl-phosphate 4-deoxy-4-formamido-L-arabinose transferase
MEELTKVQADRATSPEDSRLSVLIPVYNSEETIGDLIDTVVRTLHPQIRLWEIVLVNDGSADSSHTCILQALERHPGLIKYIRLYRNFGEHNAVICGLSYVTGDCVAIIDDDFQNPPTEIFPLVEKLYKGGYDVVYSYYEEKHHSWFRNLGSLFNNWVANALLDKPRDLYLSSFKVLRADMARIIVQYTGPYPYIDGLLLRSTSRVGRQLSHHADREAGKSGYTLRKLIHLWMNMSTGFSVTPLRIASILGLLTSSIALVLTIFFVLVRAFGPILIQQNIPSGWASTIVTITFFAGLQLSVLGIMGEYLGRLFLTVSAQPQFLVRETYGVGGPTPGAVDER